MVTILILNFKLCMHGSKLFFHSGANEWIIGVARILSAGVHFFAQKSW